LCCEHFQFGWPAPRVRSGARRSTGRPWLVRRAIAVNRPSTIVLNHVDHFDSAAGGGKPTARALSFVAGVSAQIGQRIDRVGLGPDSLVTLGDGLALVA